MSANPESSSSDRLADADPTADGPGGADHSPDAADAAGVGDIRWATEVSAATGQRRRADGGAADTPDPGAAGGAGDGAGSASPPTGDADADAATTADAVDSTEASTTADAGSATDDGEAVISAEDLVHDLERVTAERDQYLDASRRLQAEFENYRKAVAKREFDARERANESLVAELLPVLDACDGAMASGATDVEPVRTSLVDTLTKQGLTRIDDTDAPFDPERHEAVMHDPDGDGAGDGPVVAEVMRAGYLWKGRVVRPAMVRVRG